MIDLEEFPRVVIASKHLSLVTWLAQQHPEIAQRATYDPSIRAHNIPAGTAVIGSWPAHIVRAAGAYYTVEFRTKPTTAELTASDMVRHGAYLKRWYLLDDDDVARLRALGPVAHYTKGSRAEPLVDLRHFRA